MDAAYRQAQQDRYALGCWADAGALLDAHEDDLGPEQLFIQWLMEQRPFAGGRDA